MKRKGLGKGLGMGYKNLVPRDPIVHSLNAKGISQKKEHNNFFIFSEVESELSAKGKIYNKSKMAKEIKKFLMKINKDVDIDSDENFVVDTDAEPKGNLKKKDYIQLRTDGYIYEQIFDPTMNELPYLITGAIEEFGLDNKKVKIPTGYENQKRFKEMLKNHGWDFELEGQGIITIYKES